MFKKSLLAIGFMVMAVMLSGCNSSKTTTEKTEAPAVQEKVDYIVTTEIPASSYEGIIDKANPAFVKINPNFNRAEYPAGKGKITWFKTGLGSKIPAFKTGKLLEVINTDKDFVAYIGNVDEKMFEQYYIDLANEGYLFEGATVWDNMNLYNQNYAINLRFCQEGNNITTVRARILTPDEQKKAQVEIDKMIKESEAKQAAKKDEAKAPEKAAPAPAKK